MSRSSSQSSGVAVRMRTSAGSRTKLGQRQLEPLGEAHLCPPAELALRQRAVESAAGELAETGGPVLGLDRCTRRVLAGLEQLEHVGLGSGADVEDLLRAG